MQDNMHDMGNITLPSLSIDLRGEIGLVISL